MFFKNGTVRTSNNTNISKVACKDDREKKVNNIPMTESSKSSSSISESVDDNIE